MIAPPRPIRLLLISFVVPGEGNGGEIVLGRHLTGDADIELCVAERVPAQQGLIARLRHTRLSRLFNDFDEMRPFRATGADLALLERFRPDAIVTVAQHGEYRRALGLARRTGVPLITFFHDLIPTMLDLSAAGRRASWRAFRTLATESRLALCVSENMFDELGRPSTGRVLLPIPGPAVDHAGAPPPARPFKVGYAGSLFDYGPSVGAIADAVLAMPEIALTVRGRNPEWTPERVQRLTTAGVFQPPLARDAFEAWMMQLDMHLCPLIFDARREAFVRTSFPSKFLEMLRFGRPVVLWGPQYAAGVQWAQNHDAALVVTSSDPQDAARALQRLATEPQLYARYCTAARRAAAIASHDVIQARFRSILHETLSSEETTA